MSLHRNRTSPGRRIAGLLAVLMALPHAAPASAYSVTIGTGTRAIYLRVGDGSLSGGATYNSGGTPAANPTINLVSVTVPAAVVGNTTNQAMTGTGRVSSDLDGFAFCNAGQTYIGGFYRTPDNAAATAALRYTAPANLTTAGGDTIPISQITWTSTGNGDAGAQPIPAGTFAAGTVTLATINRNTWVESCHSFSYGNDAIVAAGTYSAIVTYTFSNP